MSKATHCISGPGAGISNMAVVQGLLEEQKEKRLKKDGDRWRYAVTMVYTWKHLILNYTNYTRGVKLHRRSLIMQDRVEMTAMTPGINSHAHEQKGRWGLGTLIT